MAVAIRCQHGAFFSRALELLAHRKVESVKSVGSSEFLLGTLPTEPMLNAQLASLVGKGAGRRGEIAGDLGRPQEDTGAVTGQEGGLKSADITLARENLFLPG